MRRASTPALALLLLAAPLAAAQDGVIARYCVECHGPNKQKGKIRLDDVSGVRPDLWKLVYERLASGEMPPDKAPQPTAAERKALAAHALKLADRGGTEAAPGFRRLNKREYGNTVRDLLGLHAGTFDPAAYIYDDDIDEGFDTRAESLVMSNELLLEYLEGAEKSLRQALFAPDRNRPPAATREVAIRQMAGVGGSRYINRKGGSIICRNGGKGKVYENPKSRTIRLSGRYRITVRAAGVDRNNYAVPFAPAKGPILMGFGVAPDVPASVSAQETLLKTFELKDEVDREFTFDAWIERGYYPYFSFVNGSSKPITQVRSNIRRRKLKPEAAKRPYAGPGVRISRFSIEGPFYEEWPPTSFRTTYDAEAVPDLADREERERLVLRFARRAFRRPVEAGDLQPYLEFLETQVGAGGDAHDGVIRTLAAMLGSVDFLYIREGRGALDDHALASRLSYFFWSTMPDAELSSLADRGGLRDPSVLRAQVERLLNDPRSGRFCDTFADQWLSLDRLGTMPPDSKAYREYYKERLEEAMRRETRLYFRHVLRKDLGVRDFITSDYSFINRGLARLYGVPFDGGDGFARVTFPPSAKRGGLLGHASILTLTSNGVETSPVVRGVWVLDEFLGTPPPPPPAEVPAITPDLNGAETVRDLLEKHRRDPACMECHRKMDPLGFALEAFDPIGRLRTRYSKVQEVTTHGTFMGREFADVAELKTLLAEDVRPFARSLLVRIAEYAKGRELTARDYPAVEELLDRAAKNDFALRSLIVSMATSRLMTDR